MQKFQIEIQIQCHLYFDYEMVALTPPPPLIGERPSAMELKEHIQIQQHPHKNLIPVKLAFALLVHKVRIHFIYYYILTYRFNLYLIGLKIDINYVTMIYSVEKYIYCFTEVQSIYLTALNSYEIIDICRLKF